MACKIECDLCKKILDYKETGFIKVFKRTSVSNGEIEMTIDICDECLEELKNKIKNN